MKRIGEDAKQNIKGYVTAGVIALVIAFVGYLVLIAVQNAVLSRYETVQVAIAGNDTEKGYCLERMSIEWTTTDAKLVPADAITSEEDLKGRYLAHGILKGTVLTRSVTMTDVSMASGIEVGLVVRNLQNGANGMVRTGDYIDLYLIPEGEAVDPYETAPEGLTFENRDSLPVSRHVFVTSARSDDGLELHGADTVSATRLSITVSPADAEYITRMIATKGYGVWVTIYRE